MLLGRRNPESLAQRLRGWLWPRAGWRRAGRYLLLRLTHAPGTPHGVAAGLAAGVAVSLTPFLGLHLLLSLGLAYLTRGDLLAAALGTLVGNPWTLPLILATDYRLGCLILGLPPQGLHLPGELGPDTLLGEVGRLLWPMAVGSVPLAAAAWAVIYVSAVRAVAAGRERRLRRWGRRQ
jgi:uncharacterized protein (DUF2062 family)